MTRHVVIGTAGHVDHGKTALVKALTGIDTDRFPEEQRRGITIDIGFAPLVLSGDIQASVVDVPGHEDFIRNMVAGATGIDLALLVVAADEGVMPQTLEHLAILQLLGVAAGAVAITKADLAEPDWLELVKADVEDRLRQTSISWEACTAVSVVTSQGIEALKDRLTLAAARTGERATGDLFRMPIDRVFSLAGAGTVLTGTAWSGSVKTGETVTILPESVTGRVRSIEIHGNRRDTAEPGRRTALALAGIERASAARGSVAVSNGSWRATEAIDVALSLLPDAPRPVTQRTRIRLHLGTAEVIARVTPATEMIAPGETGIARLRLEQPLVARWGDRGVIRSYSPVATIGGCVVIDPWPAPRPRRPAVTPGQAAGDVVDRVRSFVFAASSEGIPVEDLAVRVGVNAAQVAEAVKRVVGDPSILQFDNRLYRATVFNDLRERAAEALGEFHRKNPLVTGMPLELLRQVIHPATLADHVLDSMDESGTIIVAGGVARLASHAALLSQEQQVAGSVLLEGLTASGFEGRTIEELESTLNFGSLRDLAEYYVRQGTVIRVGAARYYERGAFERLTKAALMEVSRLGGATPAQLRDGLKLSRKYLIPLLEWLDLQGFTIRTADSRHVTPAGAKHLNGGA